jgi:hypothetical protein
MFSSLFHLLFPILNIRIETINIRIAGGLLEEISDLSKPVISCQKTKYSSVADENNS